MPYSVKVFFFKINEDMVRIQLMLEVLFTQDSKVADLVCGGSSSSDPSLLFSNYLFNVAFKPSAIISSAWGLSLLKMTFSIILLG